MLVGCVCVYDVETRRCVQTSVDAVHRLRTCTAEDVSRHAGKLLSEEGRVGLDHVHVLTHSDCGLEDEKTTFLNHESRRFHVAFVLLRE